MPLTPLDRFFRFVSVVENGCWQWVGAVNGPRGYGRFRYAGHTVYAHRFLYEYMVKTIPAKLELDHKCRNTLCVNPQHLEPVSHQINVLRGTSPSAQHAIKTHCPRGHEYTQVNTRLDKRNQRHCRKCQKIWNDSRYKHNQIAVYS